MNNNTKGIVAVGVVGAIVLAVILLTKDKKASYAMTIIKAGKYNSSYNDLISFDKEFLKAWADAVKNKQDTFFVQGKNHNTQGGRSTK
jgi:predicted nucleic-acid-binding protein